MRNIQAWSRNKYRGDIAIKIFEHFRDRTRKRVRGRAMK